MRKFLFILLFLTFFYGVNNYIWLKQNRPVCVGPSESLHASIMTTEYYSRNNLKGYFDAVKEGTYCPIYHFTAVFFNKLLGKSLLLTKMLNVGWFALALISIYLLTIDTFEKKVGILAMIIFALVPIIYGASRMFLESFALMSMVTFAIYYLLRSNRYLDLKNSLLFALFLALSFMTKKSAVVFLLMPCVYSIVGVFFCRQEKGFLKKRIINLFIVFLVFLILIGIRYFQLPYLGFLLRVPFEEAPSRQMLMKQLFLIGLINAQLSLPFFILFIYGSYKFIYSSIDRYKKTIYFLWFIFPIIFFTYMPHIKYFRLVLPYIPVVSIIIAYGLNSIKKKRLRLLVTVLLAFVALVQYYDFSFYTGLKLEKLKIRIANITIPYFKFAGPVDKNNTINIRTEKDAIYKELVQILENSQIKSPRLLLFPADIIMPRWLNFFLFYDSNIEINDTPLSHDMIPDLLDYMKTADFVLFNEDIKAGPKTYFDIMIYNIRKNYTDHFQYEELLGFNNILSKKYVNYYSAFEKEFLLFKFEKKLSGKNDVFYLYRREK